MLIYAFYVLLGAIFISFTLVVFIGAPYLPTHKKQLQNAIDLVNLKSGQTMLELGCGNGRVMLEAAKLGIHVTGIEINPFLVLASKWKLRKYCKITKVVWGDFWRAQWPEQVDVIFVFLLVPYMSKLDGEIKKRYKTPLNLVSFAFEIPGKKYDKIKSGCYLYKYY
jgi:SAM-dependent methyltransferase